MIFSSSVVRGKRVQNHKFLIQCYDVSCDTNEVDNTNQPITDEGNIITSLGRKFSST